MKDLVSEGREMQNKLTKLINGKLNESTTKQVNERGQYAWGMVKPDLDTASGLVYAADIPFTLEDIFELYDAYTKTVRMLSAFASHHQGSININPLIEIDIPNETTAHQFTGQEIKSLYQFAMANKDAIVSRNDTRTMSQPQSKNPFGVN
tara:strand:- start:115 stop:564 length:450 start_codon:yes stop_codon:yes gene_type:complete